MPEYNPNSVWGSKEKKFDYTAPATKPKNFGTQVEEAPAPKNHIWLWSVIIFFVLLCGGLLYFLLLRPPAGPNVSISFTKPSQILVGDPFDLSVSFSNNSSNILSGATLAVSLPDGVSFAGQSSGQRVMQEEVGDLGPGSINDQSFNLIVTGNPNSVQHIDAKLTYGTGSTSGTQFTTDGGVDLIIGGPAITLDINTPTSIFSGQNFQIPVTYTNNTSHSFDNVELTLQYPPVFNFVGSTMPSDSAGNNTWNLGTIPPAGTATITITGNAAATSNSAYTLTGNLTGEVSGDTYNLTQGTANLAIGSSPLSLSIAINNSQDYVAHIGDTLAYKITYTNNSNVTFENATLQATLVGAMFDLSTLQSAGSFSSVNDTVTWSGANTPQLLNINPGQSGSVTFQLNAAQSFPIRLLSDKDYTLGVNAQISSPTVPPGTTASSTVSVASAQNKVGGEISLSAPAYWRDANSGILNSGPYPPKVNQATQYTIHWIITNYSTDADNVTVTASLQSGTTCTGAIKSNMSTSPVCNPQNGLVTWQIPSVPATTGITGPAAEAIFQVTNTPAVNEVGNSVTLLGPSTLQATDDFTSSTLSATAAAVTTNLPDDTTIGTNVDRRVSQ